VAAIEDRDMNRAAAAMRAHLENVEGNLLRARSIPDPALPDLRDSAPIAARA
jgi:DNA-binding GntR family transcriptional regulator